MLGLIPWRIAACVLLVLASMAAWWRITVHYDRQGYDRRAAEDAAAAQTQAARNRDLQRAAELKYTVRAASRDKFFDQTAKEVRNASASLAACPIPEPVRVRLNAAAACARGDPASACDGADAVPVTP